MNCFFTLNSGCSSCCERWKLSHTISRPLGKEIRLAGEGPRSACKVLFHFYWLKLEKGGGPVKDCLVSELLVAFRAWDPLSRWNIRRLFGLLPADLEWMLVKLISCEAFFTWRLFLWLMLLPSSDFLRSFTWCQLNVGRLWAEQATTYIFCSRYHTLSFHLEPKELFDSVLTHKFLCL